MRLTIAGEFKVHQFFCFRKTAAEVIAITTAEIN
jgi:hypothetical protein